MGLLLLSHLSAVAVSLSAAVSICCCLLLSVNDAVLMCTTLTTLLALQVEEESVELDEDGQPDLSYVGKSKGQRVRTFYWFVCFILFFWASLHCGALLILFTHFLSTETHSTPDLIFQLTLTLSYSYSSTSSSSSSF